MPTEFAPSANQPSPNNSLGSAGSPSSSPVASVTISPPAPANSQAVVLSHKNTDRPHVVDQEKIAAGIRLILEAIGEDTNREGLLETPERVARMYQELFYGIGLSAASEITCTFAESTDELVLVRDIPFASICEHHLVPFMGLAHIGYIPDKGCITGLSKLARVVELASRRLQVQERMTTEIADALVQKLQPQGVAVVLEAEHLCMSIRGIKKPGTKTITSALRGMVKTNEATRAEVMALIRHGR